MCVRGVSPWDTLVLKSSYESALNRCGLDVFLATLCVSFGVLCVLSARFKEKLVTVGTRVPCDGFARWCMMYSHLLHSNTLPSLTTSKQLYKIKYILLKWIPERAKKEESLNKDNKKMHYQADTRLVFIIDSPPYWGGGGKFHAFLHSPE